MSQTTAPAQTPASAPSQGTHHYVLTVQKPIHNGFAIQTYAGTFSPTGMTRQDCYQWLMGEIVRQAPQMANASTLFFDVQPNRI
ncbi:hypothetical protein ACIQWA_36660 [Kitasatospora sp. NPDC098652]|uniref:hypothetical protein n=1 Tax=Kitasatospora sp. NPDC098652 TaxID=3364095 RepID=UPI0038292FE3